MIHDTNDGPCACGAWHKPGEPAAPPTQYDRFIEVHRKAEAWDALLKWMRLEPTTTAEHVIAMVVESDRQINEVNAKLRSVRAACESHIETIRRLT